MKITPFFLNNFVSSIKKLLNEISACTYCKDLPLGPRPVVRFAKSSKILIVGQAPGTVVRASGIPWDGFLWRPSP
ncbi:MAG: uracil-DNA glycosylase [Limisphaerales bacterium]|jgi:uracil-DNA glycosylase